MRSLPAAAVLLLVLLSLLSPAGADDWRSRAPQAAAPEYAKADSVEETLFGREIAARILGRLRYDPDRSRQTYLNLVGNAVARNANRSDLVFRFALVQSDEINAYSAPGGYVFITTATLSLMKNEAELAGVLAHEIAHIAERHVVKELSLRGSDDRGMLFFATIIGGASESAGVTFKQAVDRAVDILFRDGYRREDEMQADRNAAVYAALAGYDPNALISFLSRVQERKSQTGRSYPSYPERQSLIARVIGDDHLAVASVSGVERFSRTMNMR